MKKIVLLLIGLTGILINNSNNINHASYSYPNIAKKTISIYRLINQSAQINDYAKKLITEKNIESVKNVATEITISKTVEPAMIITETKENCLIKSDLSRISQDKVMVFQNIAEMIGCDKMNALKTVETYSDMSLPRALAGSRTLKIRQDAFERPEFENLIIHEMGHIVDLGYFKGTIHGGVSKFKDGSLSIYKNDLSYQYYKISWIDSFTRRNDSDDLDFVTGYAKSDPFEDFAETMLFYVKHNKQFRILAKNNEILAQKYDFMRDQVFDGKVFESGKNHISINSRSWDATKIK